MLAVLLAVTEGEVWGWTSARVLGLAVVGVLGLAVWVRATLRSPTPLVDLRLATRPGGTGRTPVRHAEVERLVVEVIRGSRDHGAPAR